MSTTTLPRTLLTTLRHAIKNALPKESHPVGRVPTTTAPYKSDWRRAWYRMGLAATLVMFWPFVVRSLAMPGGFGHAYGWGRTKAWWEEEDQ
ncbi:hypothetical protein SLS58_000660 [Diplodia intermedia]|uniref:Uncharacterized protein n=1 Tax=Diplodia intermedia TaxID=856260 RepID=A0ABR3U447_9PEZI